MNGEVRVVDDVPESFASVVTEAFAARPGPRFRLVLSGGATARRCYERLAALPEGTVDWSAVDALMGDERCVPPDDADANQRLVREALLDRVGTVGSFHPMSCAEGPAAYQQVLDEMRALDIVHLGLGPDGHTASLFPDAPQLQAPARQLVALAEDPHGRNPHRRMTFTYAAIARARLVVFTVAGVEKRAAYAALRAGAPLPAGRVEGGDVMWLVDRAAAG
ncbi:MAG: 6-phosphogluconolactonase [Acidimicrobiales bacterium]